MTSPALEALSSWPWRPGTLLFLLLASIVYLRGHASLRRRRIGPFERRHAAWFHGGLAAVLLALASPLEPLSDVLLSAHMVQHLLLMMLAPPLLLLGAPLAPLLFGLPEPLRRHWVAPILRLGWLRRTLAHATKLRNALLLFVLVTWLWHLPRFYELALLDSGWHAVEHAAFFWAAVLFWHPVVAPFPTRPAGSRWALVPYLLLADVQNTVLAAILSLSDRVIYPHYADMPAVLGLSPLDDQRLAGVFMWIPGSIAFLGPATWIAVRLLEGGRRSRSAAGLEPLSARDQARERARSWEVRRWNLLETPVAGPLLRSARTRRILQASCLAGAIAIAADGWIGPRLAPLNLAGIVPWVHWRWLVVAGLLVAGNLFCMACPFTLPRSLAKRLFGNRFAWPRALRSKLPSIVLLVLFFWAYETFSLWADPFLTASLLAAYFLLAFLVDGFFQGASFCKFVCPIGQFQFAYSLASPMEVSIQSPAVCQACATHDCIQGGPKGPGCTMDLFLPRKAGNLDCTFCLDCVRACPSDNVGVLAVIPAAELARDRQRAGVGRWSARGDVAALALVLTAAAFANALLMAAPAARVVEELAARIGLDARSLQVSLGFAFALAGPAVLLVAAIESGRWIARLPADREAWRNRLALAVLPLGLGMWAAHYSFHFLPGWAAPLPAVARAGMDLGLPVLGSPEWSWACCAPVGRGLLMLEILCLDAGLVAALYLAWRAARERAPSTRRALGAMLPIAAALIVLFGVGIWIVFQPMQMRGMLESG